MNCLISNKIYLFARDAVVVCSLNTLAVTAIGLIIFSTLGHLALERNLHITEVIVNGNFVVFSLPVRTDRNLLIEPLSFSFPTKIQI